MTRGRLSGGWGGSRISAVTVPASLVNRSSTRPRVTSTPPSGLSGSVNVTIGGSPCSVKRSGTGSDASAAQGSASAPSHTASTKVSPQWSSERQASLWLAASMAFSSASSRLSASTVTVLA